MSRKNSYVIIPFLLLSGVYFFEFYLNDKAEKEVFQQGEEVKEDTNSFFLPTSTTGQIIHHKWHSLSYIETYEQAEWMAYELKNEHLSNADFKRPYFEIDNAVRTKAADWRNYKQSDYDRGHLCPAADRNFSEEAYDKTFLTSNISPQKHDLILEFGMP